MRDISARELKGHNILAVERFQDNTRWMIEFSVQRPCSYGSPGDEMRLFLTEDGYQAALVSQKRREIKIKRYARVIEGPCARLQTGQAPPPPVNSSSLRRKGMDMCTVQSIKDAIGKVASPSMIWNPPTLTGFCRPLPFSEHEPMFSHPPKYKRPYRPWQNNKNS